MSASTHQQPALVEPAKLNWDSHDTPESARFQDIYFSRDDGIAESTHVFLTHNQLQSRWPTLSPDDCFVIGETGFGTGLNFLLAWQLFEQLAPPGSRLLFRSLEAHPLTRADLRRALSGWSALKSQADALLCEWPVPVAGLHTLVFAAGRITLQLYLGDIDEALEAWVDDPIGGQCASGNHAHAWFLDGFAPARNEAMWSDQVLTQLGTLSRPGTTVATFTAAGSVRRGLQAAGFNIEKCAGFGRKRDMLRGHFRGIPTRTQPGRGESPWHLSGWQRPTPLSAVVIGSGIAGCTIAAELARTGWQVSVLERAGTVASEASGNPQGALFTQLPAARSGHGEFTLHAYLYAIRYYRALASRHPDVFHQSGLLQLFESADSSLFKKLQERFAGATELAQFLSPEAASARAGIAVRDPAVWLADSGWIQPRAACLRLLDHPNITLLTDTEALRLESGPEGIAVHAANSRVYQACAVVVTSALESQLLLPSNALHLSPVRGQLSAIPATSMRKPPACVVCGEGYITPPASGELWFGASYGPGDAERDVRECDHRGNLARMERLFADPFPVASEIIGGRAGVRCATRDRLPVVGPVPDQMAFEQCYAPLQRDARRYVPQAAPYLHGVFVMTGFGSRGLTSAPLCAALLAAQINNEPMPVSRALQQQLSPARFCIRDIKRQPNI